MKSIRTQPKEFSARKTFKAIFSISSFCPSFSSAGTLRTVEAMPLEAPLAAGTLTPFLAPLLPLPGWYFLSKSRKPLVTSSMAEHLAFSSPPMIEILTSLRLAIIFSTTTLKSYLRHSEIFSSNSSSVLITSIPIEEPKFAGLAIRGKPIFLAFLK